MINYLSQKKVDEVSKALDYADQYGSEQKKASISEEAENILQRLDSSQGRER